MGFHSKLKFAPDTARMTVTICWNAAMNAAGQPPAAHGNHPPLNSQPRRTTEEPKPLLISACATCVHSELNAPSASCDSPEQLPLASSMFVLGL